MDRLLVVKIGGKVIEHINNLDLFLKDFSEIPFKKILVHGGGKKINELSEKLGLKVNMVEGRRITDKTSLEIVQMVLAGLINKNMVSRLQSFGCNAIGLTGADGNLISAIKRPLKNGIDYGMVGDIKEINTDLLTQFLHNGLVPVIASMTHDTKGAMLNTNADTIAGEVAVAMTASCQVELVYCFDKPGVLSIIDDENSVIPLINGKNYQSLKDDAVIASGMIPKVENAFNAIQRGVTKVSIIHASSLNPYFKDMEFTGTTIIP